MAMNPVELVTMPRAQDYSIIKHNEDHKYFVDQNHFGKELEKNVEQMARQVKNGDDAEWHDRKEDAKEKGRNTYTGDGGKDRKKKGAAKQGQMSAKGRQGFDMKV